MSDKTKVFLIKSGFFPGRAECLSVMQAFESELVAARAGQRSSLRMLDSFLPGDVNVASLADCTMIVVDAGGTNLRVAAVSFHNGVPVVSHLRKSLMPGSMGEVSAESFHRAIAAEVDAVRSQEPKAVAIGYCFSYECHSLPDGDARLIAWAKQIEAPKVVGQRVGQELVRRLEGGPLPIVVLNDTVATFLAGTVVDGTGCDGRIGFILGTGTNLACVENGTIRNAESGECDKVSRTECDIAFDATLPDCGAAQFEKMVSGAYLGGVGLQLLKRAAAFGLIAGEGLADLFRLSTCELDSFATGTVDPKNPLSAAILPNDLAIAREIARAVFRRAALFTAAHLAAFVRHAADVGYLRVRIAVDGSTYWKVRSVDIDGIVRKELSDLVPDVPFEIVRIDDAPMVGAAVAAVCIGMRNER